MSHAPGAQRLEGSRHRPWSWVPLALCPLIVVSLGRDTIRVQWEASAGSS
jgi:hypothetical protein